jgi:superfamily II RNA helicase
MFPFPLSEFQQKSIHAIESGNHVFTAAPTGSGKTVSAEFAIRHFAVLGGRRVIYTSPIKALSNQKYWELSIQFPSVSFGLLKDKPGRRRFGNDH